MSVITLQDQET